MRINHQFSHKSTRLCRRSVRVRRRAPSRGNESHHQSINEVLDYGKKFLSWIRNNPHILLMISLFSLLFTFDVLNLISSLCLGFVGTSLSDLLFHNYQDWRKSRLRSPEPSEKNSLESIRPAKNIDYMSTRHKAPYESLKERSKKLSA
ncbi:hypothetical protein [Pseudobacteriovorax antillogorgiicola]|uniref:Uncharacterized protein n=1 Tax=Pseudobacteriovorax antillogorgiicola TaxID=1513793 RepID=A0A1Y6B9X4_9BACT|nr:hypothetical protein [Pseudobacteriovorax antillogorgiicola]TCS58902.1 hypothetical protein EDD56_102417 [Pseudobacteriovorax antillogorgiicola]SME93374.1 hypothetical protein SAMN06296036_10226 [Pseudobacteriovorax antillogorgiicola]